MPTETLRRIPTAHRKRPSRSRIAAALLAAGLAWPAHALDLISAYRAAVDNDPTFQSARFDKVAGDEYEAIGRAALLPSAGISYSYSKNDADRTIRLANGTSQVDNPQYNSRVASLSVRQPLFNMDAWQRYKGSQAQVSYSDARFAAGGQDLIMRLTTSYLEALLAEDQLRLAIAQRDAYQENQLANQRMLEMGAGTRTDMLETRARYELGQALVVEAQNQVDHRRNELAVIIGREPGLLDSLANGLPELPLAPASLAEWERLARERNPEVRTMRHSVEYAESEVERNRAGHYPRVDLVASHSRNTSDSLFTFNQQSTVNSVGVQMSLPLYNGGGVSAQTRQAAARLAAGRAELDAAAQKAVVEVRRQYQQLASSRARMEAVAQAASSAEETVEATRKSVAGGQRVNLDVLTALQQLYQTRRDLSDARHGYLLAYVRLHAAAGTLDSVVLERVAAAFQPAE